VLVDWWNGGWLKFREQVRATLMRHRHMMTNHHPCKSASVHPSTPRKQTTTAPQP
jgi:hypothetical protein